MRLRSLSTVTLATLLLAAASFSHAGLWSSNARLNNQAIEALTVLAEAPEHGLPANRYALNRITELADQLDTKNPDSKKSELLFNELLTAAIEIYALDLLQGLHPSAFKDPRDPRPIKTSGETVSSQLQAAILKGLHRSIATNRVRNFIASIEPSHPDYAALRHALADHRQLAAQGGWPQVPRHTSGKMLQPGIADPRVPALRARLAITDPTAEDPLSAQHFDPALESAVKTFQTRHGLTADGKVGKSTRAALNVSVEERITQLELNLDRWRLMPKVLPGNHIWVNVPEYTMKLQLDREEVLNMRIVVGKASSPTPMMNEVLEHVVFSPYWHLPQKIAVREVLPKLKADPGYLDKRRFDVLLNKQPIDASTINWQTVTASNFPYRFRQRPGKNNALGRVKFIFPNRYAVYMHDTNAKTLFDKTTRTLSHGCIRLEDPEALAAALLQWDRGWKPEKVSRAMAGTQQNYVKLKQTVPVYLVYFTATIENDTVKFHQDIYGHDTRHKAAKNQVAATQVAQILADHAKTLALVADTSSAANSSFKHAVTRSVSRNVSYRSSDGY